MRIVKQDRFKNLGELHKEWTDAGVKASRATTHRRVKEFGYSCRQRRLTWAKEKKNWTVAQWSKILFSDESKFCISFGNQMKWVSEFAGQSFIQLLVLFGSVSRCQVLLENEISIFKKLVSRRKHEVLQNVRVNGCSDVGFQKTQWTNTSRWHCTPNHHRLWKLNTGLQATWAMSFSTLPPDSRTLVSKLNTKLALIWKEDFGPLCNSPVLLLLSPGKTPQSIPCEVHPNSWIDLAWQSS